MTVLKSNQLQYVQDGGKAVKGLALLLTILVPLLYALAIVLLAGRPPADADDDRLRRALRRRVRPGRPPDPREPDPGSLTNDASLQATIRARRHHQPGYSKDVAVACFFMGLLLVVAAWFAGPAARLPRTAREAIAPFLREHRGASFAVTLGLLALLFLWDPIPATGTPAGILVFTAWPCSAPRS